MPELHISVFSPHGPMNLPSLEPWCCRKHVEIYLQNITTMRKFWLDVETVVITTVSLKQSLQTRSSAFRMTNLTTGLLCQIVFICIFFVKWIQCNLSKRLDSAQAQQCKSLKWLSGMDMFILNLSLFWKISLGGHDQVSKTKALPGISHGATWLHNEAYYMKCKSQ